MCSTKGGASAAMTCAFRPGAICSRSLNTTTRWATTPSRCWTCRARSASCRAAGASRAPGLVAKGDEVWFGAAARTASTPATSGDAEGQRTHGGGDAALMAMDDTTRDGRVLATTEDSRMGISALAPGAKAGARSFVVRRLPCLRHFAGRQNHPLRRIVLRASAQCRDLPAKDRWLARCSAWAKATYRSLSRRQVGELHRQRRPQDQTHAAAHRSRRAARYRRR